MFGPAYPMRDPDYYVTDFSEYTVGAQPPDWTSRYGTGFTAQVEIVAGSLSGKALRWTKTANARQGLSWDKVPQFADTETLIRARPIGAFNNALNFIGSFQRGSGGFNSETGIRTMVGASNSGNHWASDLYAYTSGTATQKGTSINGPSPTMTANSWFWLRSRVVGSSLQRKVWHDGAAEPASWTETVTDGTITAAGWTGLFQISSAPNTEIDFFCVALRGKSASSVKR